MRETEDGYIEVYSWGAWTLAVAPDVEGTAALVLCHTNGYWIPEPRWRESDWEAHMGGKAWVTGDFCRALIACRKLSRPDKVELVRLIRRLATL